MSENVSFYIPVPDIWYDLIARLLPGTAFVVAEFLAHQGIASTGSIVTAELTIPNILMLLLAGYFVGLFFSPLSSYVAGKLHRWAEDMHKVKSGFVRAAENSRNNDRKGLIYGKMHAETVFFVQCALLSLLYWIGYFSIEIVAFLKIPTLVFLLIFSISVLSAMSVAHRRVKRAKDEVGITD